MMRDLLRLRGGRRARRRRRLTAQLAYRIAQLYGVGGDRSGLSDRDVDEVAELEFALAVLDSLPPVAAPEAPAAVPEERPPAIVLSLVRTYDWLEVAAGQEGGPSREVERMRRDVAELLAQAGAGLVTEDGPVRTPQHEVITTTPTGDPALVHHVARTLRPGVRWNGLLVRPQQVVAYVEEAR
ncbi:hypothetical protein SAMN05216298_0628 [Glycomyces sambucus]|uniref:GrpE protein n=1 Tax=Glycomyces sambucus TaxID=380244 RepID=A0A1G9D1J1_9ACTN|nr:hypothetical protein [Glycomyces sambucus]SDK57790.1 hypothetical protein SAMN05216298_0628 [Glycomyces sambucus]